MWPPWNNIKSHLLHSVYGVLLLRRSSSVAPPHVHILISVKNWWQFLKKIKTRINQQICCCFNALSFLRHLRHAPLSNPQHQLVHSFRPVSYPTFLPSKQTDTIMFTLSIFDRYLFNPSMLCALPMTCVVVELVEYIPPTHSITHWLSYPCFGSTSTQH